MRIEIAPLTANYNILLLSKEKWNMEREMEMDDIPRENMMRNLLRKCKGTRKCRTHKLRCPSLKETKTDELSEIFRNQQSFSFVVLFIKCCIEAWASTLSIQNPGCIRVTRRRFWRCSIYSVWNTNGENWRWKLLA